MLVAEKNGAAGEYAGLLVIRKYQESIGQDLGMKSSHGTKPDSAVTSHTDMKIKSRQSQGVSLEKIMSVQEEFRRTRQETEDVKEYKLKDLIIVHCYQFDNEMVAVKLCKSPTIPGGMVGRASSLKLSTVMLKWTRLMRTVNVWRHTTPCAKRRRVSARRKFRSWSKSTSTHATEDDDIVEFSPGSHQSSPWNRRLRTNVECEDASDESDLPETSQVWR